MLDFRNISKKYTNNNIENLVLSNANIKISNSEINLITGNSGVGKSTLLNIMGCLIKPDEGTVFMNDISHDLSRENLSKFRIQFFSYSLTLLYITDFGYKKKNLHATLYFHNISRCYKTIYMTILDTLTLF